MAKTVNIDGLTRASVKYNNVLRELPFFVLNEMTKALRLSMVQVQGEDIAISKRRKAGILRPYKRGLTLGNNQELIKFFEAKLKPETTYAEIVDNILQYKDKKVVSNQGEWVDNQAKKHPLELIILKDLVISVAEDVAFNLFFAERDEAVMSPSTAFNGFNHKFDLLKTAGEIAAAKNNLKATGVFAMPTDDVERDAYDQLVEFVATAHPLLRRGKVELRAADNPINTARRALQNITKYHSYPTTTELMEKLRSDANCPGLELLQDPIYGSGDQLMLTQPGLFDIGVNNESDATFVQVRNPYPDPNDVQYWIQAAYDTRILDVHEKAFRINDQINTANDFAGDYK